MIYNVVYSEDVLDPEIVQFSECAAWMFGYYGHLAGAINREQLRCKYGGLSVTNKQNTSALLS